jgi:hypothetical protein
MTTFDNREAAFENRFVHDEDRKFRIAARRNRLIGDWAASLLGLTDDKADAYAKSVVAADLQEAGDEDVIRKLVADLAAAGIDDAAIRARLAELAETARQQIESE